MEGWGYNQWFLVYVYEIITESLKEIKWLNSVISALSSSTSDWSLVWTKFYQCCDKEIFMTVWKMQIWDNILIQIRWVFLKIKVKFKEICSCT